MACAGSRQQPWSYDVDNVGLRLVRKSDSKMKYQDQQIWGRRTSCGHQQRFQSFTLGKGPTTGSSPHSTAPCPAKRLGLRELLTSKRLQADHERDSQLAKEGFHN